MLVNDGDLSVVGSLECETLLAQRFEREVLQDECLQQAAIANPDDDFANPLQG
jgi:hypothetical protein